MLRTVPHTVPRVGRSYEHFPDGFEPRLLPQAADVNLRPIEQRWMLWYRLTFVVCVLRAGGGLFLLYYSRA